MVIVWLPEARKHLKDIYLFYKTNRSQIAAMKVRKEIYSSVTHLKKFPLIDPLEIFSKATSKVYHSLVVNKYFKIVYFIGEKKIHITAIFDCRQNPITNEMKIK